MILQENTHMILLGVNIVTIVYGRIGIFEILDMSEAIKELVIKGESSLEIRKKAMEEGYKPLVIDGFNKILDGYTTLKELNSKLVIY